MGANSAGAGFGVFSSLLGGYQQSEAYRSEAAYNQQVGELNAKWADAKASDAVYRGNKAAKEQLKQTNNLAGSQRAALAAQGLDISSGSALEGVTDTYALGAKDALTIQNNAFRESLGYKIEAVKSTNQSRMAAISGKYSSRQSLLSGGLGAIGAGLGAAGDIPRARGNSGYSGGSSGATMSGGNTQSYGNIA